MRNFIRAAAVSMTIALLSACNGGGGNSLAPSSSPVTAPQTSLNAPLTSGSPDPSASSASSSHSPPPTAAQTATRTLKSNQTGPAHAPTLEQVAGNYQSSQSGWNTVGQYVTYLMTDKRGVQYASNAGMKVGFYTDAIKIPVGNASQYPESAFAHSCDGQRVYTTTSGTAAYLGNPGSSTLGSTWNSAINNMKQDQWGNYPYSWVMSDDSDDPGKTWNPAVYVEGGPGGQVSSGIYCGYSSQAWDLQIGNMMNSAPLPVLFNGDTDSSYYSYMSGKSNIMGGECEGCIASPFLANGQTKVTGSDWVTQMNAGLTNISNQKIFFLSADGNVPSDTLGYTYASYMLMYDQNYTIFRQDGQSNSGMGNPPTAEIVPTQPLISNPSSVSALAIGGVYAREYAACYIAGQLAGPCTAVVNPGTSSAPWPFLTREYHHLLQFGGNGMATAMGDTGWANANGAHPGNSISAGGWAIAFN